MPKKNNKQSCHETVGNGISCCRVESIITVDERGQMVLPKELRARANIKAGEKFAVTSWERNGEVCCITLTKVDELAEMVKGSLGPLMKEIL
jgi:antitoxin PrlF